MESINNEKIRKVLFNEVSLFVSIIAVIAIVFLFFAKPGVKMQQDIALIKQSIENIETNHFKEIEGIEQKNENQDKAINQINIKLERILTILNREN